ncbi:MAG: hypothetical protein A2679_02210 [Candidatus Sungbacteria bacterium RIFCSPHIGHO2_01_FULL_54_26]|nr:MAG: hypothetical protein A2679_02210 [Candidatus Sungbacteria bacterium RIFCSPHIGHO2_01_FULL_54_26]OHA02702.1 MAG: hypothetical protein A3C92_02670 [Candidatus Sungbacteria bacterium RIFCSPHIGHO2_02_FULL_53_17]
MAGDPQTWLMEITIASIVFVIVLLAIGYYLELGFEWYRSFLEVVYRIWERIRAIVMVLTIMASAALVGFITVILRRFNALKNRQPKMVLGAKKVGVAPMKPERAKKEIGNEWQEVRKLLQSDNTSDWNMAILRADTLLDDVLQYLGHEGVTVKERIDKIDPTMVPSLDRLLSAHRLRNIIAHDPSILHTKETLEYALRAYETAFREMGMMEEEQAA